jgi:glycosyltransferase involved in cell wall biosynthesis
MNSLAEGKVLVVSLSAPELDRLAVELAQRRRLAGYVKRYVNKRRWWERALTRAPVVGRVYDRTLGRRLPPEGVPLELVLEAGTVPDFVAAALNRVGVGALSAGRLFGRRLMDQCERAIAAAGARRIEGLHAVVASYGVALPAFRAAQRRGGRRVLNYPIAHHRFQWKLYEEEARRSPQFAAALPRFGWTSRYEEQMDRECDEADTILVGSSFVRDSFVSEGYPAERIRIIHYGVDLERFRPAPAPRPAEAGHMKVLYVGQIGQRKGVGYLLEAFRAMRRPGASLTLVGDMLPGAECYQPYRDCFEHVPNKPNAQMPDEFRSADVFVLPSLVEGMPLVVLEAMACGLPVIVTPNGARDIVRDGIDGFVVPVADADALREKLEFLLDQPQARQCMGRAAREQAQRLSWRAYAAAACDEILAAR